MFVSSTIIGTVVTVPDRKFTTKGVPVANFAVSTGTTPVDMTTWVVKAYAALADEIMDSVVVGETVIVTGMFAASERYTGSDGLERTRIECRAQSVAIAAASGQTTAPAVLVLRGTVATDPETLHDGPEPRVELDIRTSRFKRGDAASEADVTFWPVTAAGEMSDRIAEWRVGDSVVVVGDARPLADPPPDTPQVEVWAHVAGLDLYPQELPPDARVARPARSARAEFHPPGTAS